LSAGKQGRRVAPRRGSLHSAGTGRRAAAKQPRITDNLSNKLATFFSLAGLGTTALTAGSAIVAAPHSAVSTLLAGAPAQDNHKVHITPVAISILNRAHAASRSEVRSSKVANALNAAATSPNQPLSTTPAPITADDRLQLRAFAGSPNQLTSLVTDAHNQAVQAVSAQIAAQKAAEEAATARAVKAAEKTNAHYNADSNMTYPTTVSNPGRSYSAPRPSQAEIDSRVMPVVGSYQLSARFGQRGYMWSSGWHTGIDFVVPTGTPVRAAVPGTIIHAGWAGPYGNRIEIETGDGFLITYNHLSHIGKTSGTVSAGEVLGRSGATGNVTGPHLHFEVLYNGEFVSPAIWLWGTTH
jgi:murein DD-endopeptidase MepM/ murein hydrolase activator NlpD